MRMLGSPPLPQPMGQRVVAVRKRSERMARWVFFLLRVFQKKRSVAGSRQRSVLFGLVRVAVLCAVVGLTVVMVLMVATAPCAAPLREMLEGSKEQVAYWPRGMGVQLGAPGPL